MYSVWASIKEKREIVETMRKLVEIFEGRYYNPGLLDFYDALLADFIEIYRNVRLRESNFDTLSVVDIGDITFFDSGTESQSTEQFQLGSGRDFLVSNVGEDTWPEEIETKRNEDAVENWIRMRHDARSLRRYTVQELSLLKQKNLVPDSLKEEYNNIQNSIRFLNKREEERITYVRNVKKHGESTSTLLSLLLECNNEELELYRNLAAFVSDLEREIQDKLRENEELRKGIILLKGRLERVQKISENFIEFGTLVGGELKPVDVNKAIADSTTLYSRAEIKFELTQSLPPVLADEVGLWHAFGNLISNAQDTIRERRKEEWEKVDAERSQRSTEELIDIYEKIGELKLTIITNLEKTNLGWVVVIRFADEGCGIPKENLGKIFKPYFTTKGKKRGTGLGLSIVHKIVVDKLGGSIEVESQVGKGTTFTIKLPLNKPSINRRHC